jgi:succinate-semialdehyde dehydrogenase/glutarate-semialdehyde dehydrogenase
MDGRLILADRRVETGDLQESLNPATLEAVGRFNLASPRDCDLAVQAAKSAFPEWRNMPVKEKKQIFLRTKQILLRRGAEVAETLAQEKGGPLTENWAMEIFPVLEALGYYARSAVKNARPRRSRPHIFLFYHKTSEFHFQPLGPTLIIAPWNFPFLIPGFDCLSALTAGNTVILRPSSSTALTGLLLGEIFLEAGLPPGVLNVVPCKTQHAERLITSPDVQTVMFTGSTVTGKKIMALASHNLTNLTLELGGKDPMIVCRDADVERAARGAVWGAFCNCGQSCGSIERAYVHSEIVGEFTERVTALTQEMKVGDPLTEDTDMGPMTTLSQLRLVEEHIRDAVGKGAAVLCGGDRVQGLKGYFLRPAVLSRVDHSMRIMQEETFGPTLPIMPFEKIEEAVDLANDSEYGLTASVWTRSRRTAAELADAIETGTVSINDHMTTFPEPSAIWGGIKQTGFGRSHGPYGMLELMNIKYQSFDFAGKKDMLWWYPYSRHTHTLFERAASLYHHPSAGRRARDLGAIAPQLGDILRKVPLRNFIKSIPNLFSK